MQVDIGPVFSDEMVPPCRAGGHLLALTSPLPAILQLPQAPGLGRLCSSGATGTATGVQRPGHLTLAKLLGLHSHHVPMCQVDWACCFWNTYLPGIPSAASVTRCCRSQRSHTGPLFSQAQPRSAPALCGFSHNVFLIYYNHLCEPMSAVRGKKHQHCH